MWSWAAIVAKRVESTANSVVSFRGVLLCAEWTIGDGDRFSQGRVWVIVGSGGNAERIVDDVPLSLCYGHLWKY